LWSSCRDNAPSWSNIDVQTVDLDTAIIGTVGIERLRGCCKGRLGVWLHEDFHRESADEDKEEEDSSDVDSVEEDEDQEEEEPLQLLGSSDSRYWYINLKPEFIESITTLGCISVSLARVSRAISKTHTQTLKTTVTRGPIPESGSSSLRLPLLTLFVIDCKMITRSPLSLY
jgi:hypothetical protein